jgi:DNA-binding response OmpR family regulator
MTTPNVVPVGHAGCSPLSTTYLTAHALVPDGDELLADLHHDERRLLRALGRDGAAVLTKDSLMRSCKFPTTRVLDSAAVRLREHLRRHGAPGLVQNIWGVGYRLLPPSQD